MIVWMNTQFPSCPEGVTRPKEVRKKAIIISAPRFATETCATVLMRSSSWPAQMLGQMAVPLFLSIRAFKHLTSCCIQVGSSSASIGPHSIELRKSCNGRLDRLRSLDRNIVTIHESNRDQSADLVVYSIDGRGKAHCHLAT
jgi:hypothetical protein